MTININIEISDEQLLCLAGDLQGFPHDEVTMTAELTRREESRIYKKLRAACERMVKTQAHILGDSRPIDMHACAEAIMAHPDFKTRDMRDAENDIERATRHIEVATEKLAGDTLDDETRVKVSGHLVQFRIDLELAEAALVAANTPGAPRLRFGG